jgi:hypothetical protein
MSAASDSVGTRGADIERLRDPHELRALVACILANVVVVALAIGILLAGTEWLVGHPRLGHRVETFRVIAIAAVVAFPATVIGRRVSLTAAEGNGVRVSPAHMPELYDELRRACTKLGLDHVPELFLGRVNGAPAAAYSTGAGRSAIVLDADLLFDKEWQRGIDWIAFVLASAVGAIRLGHTQWWVELTTAYVQRIPGLRTPLFVAWTRSRDRCAAFVVPHGIRGLLIEATGKDAIWDVDVGEFMSQPLDAGFWDVVATMRAKRPTILHRARALYDAGLFDLEKDRARLADVRSDEDA